MMNTSPEGSTSPRYVPTPPPRLMFGYSVLKVPEDASQLAELLGCEVADAMAIAGRSVRLLSVTSWNEGFQESPEFVLVEFMDDQSKIEIPLGVLDFVGNLEALEHVVDVGDVRQGWINDVDGNSGVVEDHEVLIVRDKESEKQMIQSMAAESIQEAYKRYRECKPAMRAKRFNKSQQLVLKLASDTIKNGIRKSLALKRKQKQQEPQSQPQQLLVKEVESVSDEPVMFLGAKTEWHTVGLPQGYEKRCDDIKKRWYYVNHHDKSTSWRHPLKPPAVQAGFAFLKPTTPASLSFTDTVSDPVPFALPNPAPLHDTASSYPAFAGADADSGASASKNGSLQQEQLPFSVPSNLKAQTSAAPTVSRAQILSCNAPVRSRKGSKSSIASANAMRSHSPLRVNGIDPASTAPSVSLAVASVPIASQAPTPTQTQSLGQRKLLVVDVAFARAFREECSSTSFTASEFVVLLDALEVELALPHPTSSFEPLAALLPESVELPTLLTAAFASRVTQLCRSVPRLVRRPYAIEISEATAEKGTRRIRALIEGPWHGKARGVLLHSCHSKHGRQGRPSMWPSASVCALFVGALQFPEVHFSNFSGRDVLELDGSLLRLEMGVGPSLLLARFRVYQHVLRLLDQWWEQGHRPGDDAAGLDGALLHLPAAPTSSSSSVAAAAVTSQPSPPLVLPSLLSCPNISKINSNSNNTIGDKKSKKSKTPAVTAPLSKEVAPGVPSSPKRWGHVGSNTVRSSSGGAGVRLVEVAPAEALLQAWAPLSRAYGWGLPLESLSSLGARVGGCVGSLSSAVCAERTERPGEAGETLELVKGCCWVVFAPPVDFDNGHPLESLSRLCQPIVSRVLGTDPVPSLLEPNPSSSLQPSRFFAVLIPLQCLRGAADSPLDGRGPVNGAALSPGDVIVGRFLRVANAEVLCRSCERFEWWDRPPPEALALMAGQRVEVVSVAEMYSNRRVGVRVLSLGAFDGLPLEALLPLPELAPSVFKAVAGPGSRRRRRSRQAWTEGGVPETLGVDEVKSTVTTAAIALRENENDSENSVDVEPFSRPLVSVTITTGAPQQQQLVHSKDLVSQDTTATAASVAASVPMSKPVRLPKPMSASPGPRIKVRERGDRAQRFQVQTSEDIVRAFYMRMLKTKAPLPELDVSNAQVELSKAELVSTKPNPNPNPNPRPKSVPLWMSQPKRSVDVAQNVLPHVPVQAPAIAASRSPPAALRLGQAEIDAVFAAPAPESHGAKGRMKRANIGPQPDTAGPGISPGPLRLAVIRPEFDETNAIFDVEPSSVPSRKSRKSKSIIVSGNKARKSEQGEDGMEKVENGENLLPNISIEPWDDGTEFFVSGLFYSRAQQENALRRSIEAEVTKDKAEAAKAETEAADSAPPLFELEFYSPVDGDVKSGMVFVDSPAEAAEDENLGDQE